MSVAEHLRTADADDVLITRVRGGDLDAYGVLFERHRAAALRLARSLSNGPDADDLVADAFSKVLATLQKGGGPDLAFRAYLLTAVRRLHVDRIRAQSRATPTDDIAALDKGEPFSDTAVAAFENGAAARAFKSLPERWQMVLWHLEVERQKPAEIAPLLGMSPNAVAALAYRAREGLRQAFVQMHAGPAAPGATSGAGDAELDERCRAVRDQLGSYVRQGLSRRESARVEDHLEGCRPCTALYLELTEVNSSLGAVLGPVVLGSAAAAYLSGTATGGAAVAGVGALLGRVRDFVVANSTSVAVGTAATVAVAAGGAVAVNQMNNPAPTVDAAVTTSTLPSPRAARPSGKPTTSSAPATAPAPSPTPAAPAPTSSPSQPAATPTQQPTQAPTTPSGSPSTTPTGTPSTSSSSSPSTSPSSSPSGSPSDSPSTSPSSSPTTAAPAVHPLALVAPKSAAGAVTLRVTGFEAGEAGVVTLRLPVSLPWWITPGCSGGRATRTCTVSAADPTVTVRFRGLVGRVFSASFSPASGVEDTSDGDDSVRVMMHGYLPIDIAIGPLRGATTR